MEKESAAEFVVRPALRLANLTKDDVFVDLRCGDGRFLFAVLEGDDQPGNNQRKAAVVRSTDSVHNSFEGTLKSNSLDDENGAALTKGEGSHQRPKRIIGVEFEPDLISTLKQKLNVRTENLATESPISLQEEDIFEFDLEKAEATCVLCNLSPEELIKLKPKLESFLKGRSVDIVKSEDKRKLNDNVRSEPSVLKARNNEAGSKYDQDPREKIKLNWSTSFRKLFGLKPGVSSSTSSNSSYPEVPNSAATSGSIPSFEPPLLVRSTDLTQISVDNQSKPKRRIISVMFSIPEWTASKVLEVKEVVSEQTENIPEWEREESPAIYIFLYDADSIRGIE